VNQDALAAALQALLKRKRAMLDPDDYGFARAAGQGRRAEGRGLTQAHMDELLHVGRGTYAKLESGTLCGAKAPEALLKSVGEFFRLDRHEYTWLWRMTWRRDPPEPLHDAREDQVPGEWLRVIHGSRHMAYITNHRWDVLAHNPRWPRMFPGGEAPANTMEWMLLHADARTILGEWETAWAPLVVPQLWSARAAYPGDTYLADLEKRVLDDPKAGPIYETFGDIYVDPDGSTRPLNHAELGPGWVTMCSSAPRSAPRCHTMALIWDDKPPTRFTPLTNPTV
jgi:hypothetical protein